MRLLLLALLTGCLPELDDVRLPSEPAHDWDGDGLTEDQGDCDDEDASVAAEGTYFTDADGDGWGAGDAVVTCAPAADQVAQGGDCDDASDSVHPQADELCNGLDDDCDTTADEDATDGAIFYEDADEDGYGDAGVTTVACEAPDGYADVDGDCDDADPDFHPGAPETDCADPNDYNCDGSTGQDDADGDGVVACEDCDDADDQVTTFAFYADADADGYGNAAAITLACDAPEGHVADATDCDDGRSGVNPAASEICNGLDDDCDDLLDDADAGVDGLSTWHLDGDGDGHGDPDATTEACSQPEGYVADSEADDCDDSDVLVYPGAEEACDATADLNCDGAIGDVDGDGDGAVACEDCDDGNAGVHPGATESCNNVDDDCDGTKDEGVTTTYYADADADGYGDAGAPKDACSLPTGHVANATDCDDAKTSVNPGATEACNLVDDDCDGTVDDGVKLTFYRDADSDGYGAAASSTTACAAPSGYVADATDCDDGLAIVNPGADEICDGADNDCDTSIDDDDSDVTGTTTVYADGDDDGYGTSASTLDVCSLPTGYSETSDDCDDADASTFPGAPEACDTTVDRNCDGLIGDVDSDGDGEPACSDCDDTNPARYPGATETCNAVDDDCDGAVDDGVKLTFFRDKDGDSYGDAGTTTQACSAPSGYVANDDDCDDTSALVKPGGTETCNLLDDDCDGSVDEGVKTTYYVDSDGDLYGSTSGTTQACSVPSGYAANSTDCDDTRASVHPGGTEVCNSLDDDCDSSVDEGVKTVYYRDADVDGYGASSSTISACTKPSGYVTNSTDCNDAAKTIYPGATEVCDGVDQDCDGLIDDGLTKITYYADSDSDGYGVTSSTTSTCSTTAPTGYAAASGDCNDSAASIHPGATEACNSIDDDCDSSIDEGAGSTWYRDSDGDTYGDATVTTKACTKPTGYVSNATDCDDTRASVSPAGTEVCNLLDDDCDSDIDEDVGDPWYGDGDGDGYGSDLDVVVQCSRPTGYVAVGGDCDDTDKTVYPGEYCFMGGSRTLYPNASARLENPATALGDLARSVAGLPDCDGDGYDDFLVGDPEAGVVSASDGAVYVVTTKPTGAVFASTAASGVVYGNTSGVQMGWAVASLGDVDGDGSTEFVTGAPYAGATSVERGRIYLMSCPISGSVTGTSARAKFLGESGYDHAGWALSATTDVDSDGIADFAIGAPGWDDAKTSATDAGSVYVISGSAATTGNLTLDSSTALTIVGGTSSSLELGKALGQLDVNADGVPDLAMGAPGFTYLSAVRGAVYVLEQPAKGVFVDGDMSYTWFGGDDGDLAGSAISTEGDVDGDGYGDVLVGAPGYDDAKAGANAGAAYLLYGGSMPSGAFRLDTYATAVLSGESAGDAAGTSVALADVDKDGRAEVVVGAPYVEYSSGTTVRTDAGAAYILFAPSGAVSLGDADAIWTGAFDYEEVGSSLGSLGDIDGDSWGDLGVGAAQTSSTFTPRLYLLYGKDL